MVVQHSGWLNACMKRVRLFIFVVFGIFTSAEAFASSVYKCIADDGGVTFGYTPCIVKAVPVQTTDQDGILAERMVEIEGLDKRISKLNRSLRDLRLEKESAIQETEDTERRRNIRIQFEETSDILLKEIAMARQQRGKLIEGSIGLLSERTGS